jgi:hypothetical protein
MRSSLIRKFFLATALFVIPAASFAGVFVSVTIAPPPLPVYAQPLCPGEGYLWTPGYWAYGVSGYYWIPGVWVQPPTVGVLWTPGYWGWSGGSYLFHAGYWGPHIGFYGGVNYGFGYTGVGYEGGYWNHGVFAYNRSVNHIGNFHNVYNRTIVVNHYTNVSYNGGHGGIEARPSGREEAAFHEQRFEPTHNQQMHFDAAAHDRNQLASFNGGHPHSLAVSHVGERAGSQQERIGNGVRSGEMTTATARPTADISPPRSITRSTSARTMSAARSITTNTTPQCREILTRIMRVATKSTRNFVKV